MLEVYIDYITKREEIVAKVMKGAFFYNLACLSVSVLIIDSDMITGSVIYGRNRYQLRCRRLKKSHASDFPFGYDS
jgi:hypothetical protein